MTRNQVQLVNKLILIGVIAGTAIVGIVLGLIAYSYTQIQASLDNVSFAGIDHVSSNNLGSAIMSSIQQAIAGNWYQVFTSYVTGIKFNLYFGLTNHGIFPVYIPQASYNLAINGVNIGQGQIKIDETINPGDTKELPTLADISTANLEPAAISILGASGMVDVQVNGMVDFKFLGLTVPVPFQFTKQINLKDEVMNYISGANSPLSGKTNSFTSTTLIRTHVSLQTSDYTVNAGQIVTLVGRLTDSDNNGISNQEVDIKRHILGSLGSTLSVTRTDTNGDFSTTWQATKPLTSNTAEVYAVFKGSSQYAHSNSPLIQIHVMSP